MDFSKYPIEKLFYFAAGIIPGFIALLIFQLAAPGSFDWFFALGFLGYKTKLALVALVAFVIGNSLTTFLSALFGMVGGILGARAAQQPYKPAHSYDVAPWRDPRWRSVLKYRLSRLGVQAPNDTRLMSQGLFDLRREAAKDLPEEQRSVALAGLNLETIHAEMDDANWAHWYDQYHQIVLEPDERNLFWHVRRGLNFNLETTALYVLISALFVPAVRRWWCILPASLWALLLLAEEYSAVRQFRDKWFTLSAQIKYLGEGNRSAGGEGGNTS